MEDKYLVCKDCGREFVFTVAEQEFYAEKGFENEPGRCLDCRKARKQRNERSAGHNSRRENRPMFNVICSSCGQETTVPFEPSEDRPVYCRDCFQAKKAGGYR